MLLIHTGDLHLGKTLHERELHDEQAAMLEALLDLIAERRPAGLLLAGDLYDRAIPPPEAIGLFDSFLSRALEAAPGLTIVAIPGNHDSASRLAFGDRLFRRAGLHFRLRAADSLEPIIIEEAGERCAVWALPFLGGAAELGGVVVAGEAPGEGRGQAARFAAAIAGLVPRLLPESRNVLVAHCFASGGQPSDSERGFLGLAEEVDARLFDPFDYAALGHLHRPQAAGAKGRYSGSPLAYSFGEASTPGREASPRGFLLVELPPADSPAGGPAPVRTELVSYRPLHRLVRIDGTFAELCAAGPHSEYRDDFVELRLTDAEPVLDPAERLKLNFPNLLSVRQSAFEIRLASGQGGSVEMDCGRDPEDPARLVEDFILFHREMKGGAEAEAQTLELVEALVREVAHAAD